MSMLMLTLEIASNLENVPSEIGVVSVASCFHGRGLKASFPVAWPDHPSEPQQPRRHEKQQKSTVKWVQIAGLLTDIVELSRHLRCGWSIAI
jgi:hypothetical protein